MLATVHPAAELACHCHGRWAHCRGLNSRFVLPTFTMRKPKASAPASRTLSSARTAASRNRQASAAVTQAEQHLGAGDLTAAENVLRIARQHHPDDPAITGLLAVLAIFGNRTDDALELAKHAVHHAPSDARLLFTLGRAHKAHGELDEAVLAYRKAIELAPHYAEAHVSLGIALKAQGDVSGAITCHEQALRIDPKLAVAHANLAVARAALRDRGTPAVAQPAADACPLQNAPDPAADLPNEADIESLRLAVDLDPGDPELHKNFATLLQRAGRYLDAAQAFNRALTLDPSDGQSCMRLGACLSALGNYALASEAYEKWLRLNAHDAAMMRALSEALTRIGEADAGLQWAQKALAIEPDPASEIQLGGALMQLRRMDEALAHCRAAVARAEGRTDIYSSMLLGLNYLFEDPEPIFAAHADYGLRLPAPAQPRPTRRSRAHGERLRIGYVSGDFVNHSVAFFIGALLQEHDTSRFEVFCYHNNAQTDQVTRRFKTFGHHWIECHALSDDALYRRIVADGIDILIDLSGHTSHSRLPVFAFASAPVQIGYLGYPTVSGVPQMDFRITDAVIDPMGAPDESSMLASDRPLRLPGSMFCYQPGDAPDVTALPALRHGHITFGSFNNISKITDHTLTLWADVMNAVPGSRLLLKAASMAQASNRANIEQFMSARGIAADRLQLMHRMPDTRSHLEVYGHVDIALDSYPYNGATTTCEALWMGVPVVTRAGRTHTSRMGASILTAIGQSDWVGASDADYIAIATRLAHDTNLLSTWRARARTQLQASPLMDSQRFTRDFERLLEQAWSGSD